MSDDLFRLIVAGSRTITSRSEVVDAIADSPWDAGESEIVHGGAEGVDSVAGWLAHEHDRPATVFEADWATRGKAAGPIRNAEMAEYGDALVAVWDGQSRGTRSMINKALDGQIGVYVHVVDPITLDAF